MDERRPRWVYVGDEPDPRNTLANERTFLAWVRTMLAVVAGAVALESIGVPEDDTLRTVVVLLLLGGAAATMSLAYLRWASTERALRLGTPLPAFTLGLTVTIAIVLATVALGVLLVS